MDINNQSNQELLSAYLDDALSGAELAQVESWLATDASAVHYLNELRSNRQSLKALAASPNAGLKRSLADRVLAQTAEIDRAKDDRKVRLPESLEQPGSLPSESQPSHSQPWRIWATLAATAAALVCMVVWPFWTKPSKQGFVSNGSVSVGPSTSDVVTNEPSDLPPVTEPAVIASETPDGKIVGNSRQIPEERPDPNSAALVQMMLIVDVLMSDAAWEGAKFDELIAKNGIRYEKEVVASPSLMEEFIKSPLDAGPDAEAGARSPAAVVYVDCPLNTISQILLAMEQDTRGYPEFDVKMAMIGGPMGRGEHAKLLRLLREQPASSGRGVAKLVVPDNADKELGKLLPVYETHVRKTPQVLRDGVAARLTGDFSKMAVGNLNGELLLILRKQ